MPRTLSNYDIFSKQTLGKNKGYLVLIFPRGMTAVVMVARTGSLLLLGAALGGDVSFLGFLDSLLDFC